MYHPNGNISSKGKYVNRLKEGKWQFFSELISGYVIVEDHYSSNLKDGLSIKFYMDSTAAEKITFIKNIRQGEWIKYYPNGTVSMKSSFLNDKINGPFEVWYENGNIQFSGQYKNDLRDGLWYIYNKNGTIKYKIEYQEGVTKDHQMDIDESDYLDLLEKNKGKIADPEKTGVIW
jgi:antitoxin component YwqK of YwqJK toxin-antitoxin module